MNPVHVVDGSGLEDGAHQDGQLGIVWNTATHVEGSTSWLQLDLGDIFDIAALKMWNYHSSVYTDDRRGLKSFTLEVWSAKESWSTVAKRVHLARAGRSVSSDPYYGFAFKAVPDALPAPYDQGSSDVVSWLPLKARYLRLTNLENYGESKWGNSYGLSELKVFRRLEAAVEKPKSAAPAEAHAEEAAEGAGGGGNRGEDRAGTTTQPEGLERAGQESEARRPSTPAPAAHGSPRHLHNTTFSAGRQPDLEEIDLALLDQRVQIPIVIVAVVFVGFAVTALWKRRWAGHKSSESAGEEDNFTSQEALINADGAEKVNVADSDSDSDGQGTRGVGCGGGIRSSMLRKLRSSSSMRSNSMRSPRPVNRRSPGQSPTRGAGAATPASPYSAKNPRQGRSNR